MSSTKWQPFYLSLNVLKSDAPPVFVVVLPAQQTHTTGAHSVNTKYSTNSGNVRSIFYSYWFNHYALKDA